MLRPNHPARNRILKAVAKFNPKTILEVGCFCSEDLANIRHHFPDIEYSVADYDKKVIQTVNKMYPRVKAYHHDIHAPIYRTHDLVIFANILQYCTLASIRNLAFAGKNLLIVNDDTVFGTPSFATWEYQIGTGKYATTHSRRQYLDILQENYQTIHSNKFKDAPIHYYIDTILNRKNVPYLPRITKPTHKYQTFTSAFDA